MSKALAIIKFANDKEDKGVSITSTYVFLMCFVDWEKARTDFEACALFWRPLSLQCDEFSLPVDTCKLYLHSSFHVLVRIGRVCVVWCGLLWSSVVGSSLAWSGLVWCALVLSGLVWFGLVWSDPDSALVWVWSGSGLVRSGPSGPVRAGQIWSGLVWSGLVWPGSGPA